MEVYIYQIKKYTRLKNQQIYKQEANSLKKHTQQAIKITNKQAERASKGQHQPPQPIKTDPRILFLSFFFYQNISIYIAD